jgi:molybdopterin converting factor subunit 1
MKVLYFASLKVKTKVAQEDLALPSDVKTVADLVDWLKQRSPGHAEALADLRTVRVAVNQEHAGFDAPVSDGDEIAFFPPVTGG